MVAVSTLISDPATTAGWRAEGNNFAARQGDGADYAPLVAKSITLTGPPAGTGVNAQAAIPRGGAAGFVATFASNQSPASVATLTTVNRGMTLINGTGAAVTIATTDLVIVNKPAAQAGLGVGNEYVSSAGVLAVSFANLSAGFLTPTAAEKYGVIALRGLNSVTSALTPVSIAAATTAEQQFSITGLRAGELVKVNKPTIQPGIEIVGARVVSNNLLGITFGNVTSAPLTPTAAESYTVISMGGLDALNNEILFQVSAAPVAVPTLSSLAGTLTIGNLAVTDTVKGVQKPTQQNGLIPGAGFVSAAGVGAVIFGNFTTASITPTANEVYGVSIFRPNPAAPLVVQAVTLTPASVAANTTAEQTFAVTSVVAASMVWVNKPTAQAGLGILGCRVSSAGNIAITFANFTSATLTPTAGESYLVGNFQMPLDTAGGAVIQSASIVEQSTVQLANAMRAALVSAGIIIGA